MAQNIYDNSEFFAGYSQLPRQVYGLAGAPEWPTVREMLPDMAGKRVLDLGCGFGWASRWMSAQGATYILGLDLSQNMLRRAKADIDDPAIHFRVADIETVELPLADFDLAYSALTFHYIKDFPRLVRVIHQALVPGGRLVFSIEHPIFMTVSKMGWITCDGRPTWPVNRYADEGERRTNWFAANVIKYHRKIGTTLNALISVGFSIAKVEEFSPSAEQIENHPNLRLEAERPMILIVSATR